MIAELGLLFAVRSSVRFGKKDGKKGSSRHGRGEVRGAAGEKAKGECVL